MTKKEIKLKKYINDKFKKDKFEWQITCLTILFNKKKIKMKNYRVLVVNKLTGEILRDQNEFSKTKKYLSKKYKMLYFFEKNTFIKITRLIKKPGTQMTILDIINQ